MPNRLFKSFPAIVQTSGTQVVVLCGRPQPSGAWFFTPHDHNLWHLFADSGWPGSEDYKSELWGQQCHRLFYVALKVTWCRRSVTRTWLLLTYSYNQEVIMSLIKVWRPTSHWLLFSHLSYWVVITEQVIEMKQGRRWILLEKFKVPVNTCVQF